MAEETPPPELDTHCRTCAEPIRRGARKCIHCDSYQDWRRYFGFSTTVLSLLIALFAVAGQTVGIVQGLMHRDEARIGIAIQRAAPSRLTVLVFNDGNRAATISDGLITIPNRPNVYLTLINGDALLIPPRTTTLVTYISLNPVREAGAAECTLSISASDENGRYLVRNNFACADFSSFFGQPV